MPTQKWFDRKFNFNTRTDQFLALLESLSDTPSLLQSIINTTDETKLNDKPGGKWSIKEQVGHLYIMEPLWRKRFEELRDGKTEMSPADLTNAATDKAEFNNYPIAEMFKKFSAERKQTITMLKNIPAAAFTNSLFHPRLQQAMHITDLMYFVAEHDMHHLNVIKEMIAEQL